MMSWARGKIPFRLIAGFLGLVLVVWLWSQVPFAQFIETVRLWILSLGIQGVAVFCALYVLITVVLGPASGLTLLAGLVYGAWGFPLVVVSATLSAAVAFLLGRYVARERVNHWIAGKPRLLALNSAVSDEGWRVVLLMRLSPVIPFGLQSYLFAVTHIGFVPFVLATFVGTMPATALYVYIGSLGQAIGTAGVLQWILVLAGLVATGVVAWVVGKRAAAALDRCSSDSVDAQHSD